MSDWLSQFSQASRQTKYFVFTAVSLTLLIIVTLVWSYAHTVYARSAVRARVMKDEVGRMKDEKNNDIIAP